MENTGFSQHEELVNYYPVIGIESLSDIDFTDVEISYSTLEMLMQKLEIGENHFQNDRNQTEIVVCTWKFPNISRNKKVCLSNSTSNPYTWWGFWKITYTGDPS